MHRPTYVLFAAILAACANCAEPPPAPSSGGAGEPAEAKLIPADPKRGFQFPYLLRLPPAGGPDALPFLLVEPNNSGHVSNDFQEHIDAALALAKQGLGGDVARRLGVAFFMPVFPRPPDLYTQSLDRKTLLTTDPQLKRLDLQLLAMISDARERLGQQGIRVNQRVFLTGFSASGVFVTRFAALHPDAVQALAAGGVNAFVILPLAQIDATPLRFPLGIADLPAILQRPSQIERWRGIPQLLFMGEEDKNDAVQFEDAYPAAERAIIYKYVGEKMLPDRWDKCQQLYREAGAAVAFTTYPRLNHGTTGRVHADIASFFRQNSTPVPP